MILYFSSYYMLSLILIQIGEREYVKTWWSKKEEKAHQKQATYTEETGSFYCLKDVINWKSF